MRSALRAILRPLPSAVLTAHPVSGTDTATYTFNGVSYGRAAPGRKILVALNGGVGGVVSADVSSLTVSGATATRVVQQLTDTNSNRVSAQYIIQNENDASGTVVVNFGGILGRLGLVVYPLYGLSSIVPFSTGTATITSGASSGTVNVIVPARGFAIANSHFTAAALQTATWAAPFNEDVDEQVEATGLSQHAASTVGIGGLVAAAPTFSGTASVNCPLVCSAWGP